MIRFLTFLLLFSMGLLTPSWAKTRVFSLDSLFAMADRNALPLHPSRTAVEEADAAWQAARMERLPAVQAALSVGYNGDGYITDRDFSDGFKVDIPHFGNSFSVEVAQVIYAGGAISRAVKMADLGRQMAQLRLEQKRQEIHLLVTGYYLDLCKLSNQMEVYDHNIALTEQLIASMAAKCEAGVLLDNDRTRYELQLETLKLQRLQVADAYTILQLRLGRAIGLDEGVKIQPEVASAARMATVMERDAAWEQAAEHSLALKQLSTGISISEQQEQLTRAANRPTVALIAQNHLNGPVTIEIPALDKNFNYWFVGVGVSFKLDGLYKNRHRVRSSQLATARIEQEREAVAEELEIAVRQACTAVREAETALVTRRKGLELATRNYEVIDNRYRNELALLTDMLDASNARLSAELELVNAEVNLIYKQLFLNYLCGQL